MDKKIQNIKAGIYIENTAELSMAANGERLHDYEAQFNDLYYEAISKEIKHNEWGVWFKQISEYIPKFIIDIYPLHSNQKDYLIIYNIIKSNPPNGMEIELMAPYWDFDKFIGETV